MTMIACDACKLSVAEAAPGFAGEGIPEGWYVRTIEGRTFTLCDCCGSIRHFKGGVSAYLQKTLGVPEYAEIVFEDVPGGGLHRQRRARADRG